ncbi:MAG: phosphoribosylglycinamide formyltransferase [Acidimicrobiales bacterium]|jgi:phosphoribosylglycinamide formyltransferase-1|nr:phosphoribosylglycinamide formyltransferase [Acidimicrobiaceae bacterium]MDP6161136.1 phosphoribosylglycinamide formyltransferase [Acidimicrobiales bacterium]HJL91439.1 phosphoribosylglycinamide formyltransferase [Acidimicrobiales bacterium]HJO40870.1 phosphoribosylglycinamide formyltransferase [Acidimicrobiales bacterium]
MRLAVLVSGTGSILEAISHSGIEISLVVADRECEAIQRALDRGLNVELIERSDFGEKFDRVSYTNQLVRKLEVAEIELIAMAGFGTILEKPIYDAYAEKVLNTHPSLLPAFPGWNAVEEAIIAGVEETGCTIHQATLEVDSGPILAQETVPILEGDNTASLHERIKIVERKLYVSVIKRIMNEPDWFAGIKEKT